MKKLIPALIFCLPLVVFAQNVDLSYYLPKGVSYNPAIPTPQSVIGHEVGEYHVTHDKLVNYMYALDKASDRITLEVTGYTYEKRPLLLLTVTSPKNHQNIEAIRTQHLLLSDPNKSTSVDVKNMPTVFYMGCSIHGNEPSGANAGLIIAYHLAAAQGPEIEKYLENTVLLFDPSFNPDGLQRFSSWVNSRKSMHISTDPNDTEHNEAWPGGRFNHYWFDLNRDWLVTQHPESQARIKKFQEWKPNVLTDHHEQGTNSTFFFMPGVPSRVNPITPLKNQELTKKMGEYHAKALDEIGSLYYTMEGYDDFYYGKGSTYPDAQGCIGILFEQASSRGHAQESTNGVLTFPFTIRNHFVTMLSSLKAVNELREELLTFQRDFYKNAQSDAAKDLNKGYIIGSTTDKTKLTHFVEMLLRQNIEVYKVSSAQSLNGKQYDAESSYIVPSNQPQYKLMQAMFYKQLKFQDSLFYDISSWTLPLAFGIDYDELKALPALGEKVSTIKMQTGKIIGEGNYAYVFEGTEYYSPRAMYRLLSNNVRVKVSNEIFHIKGKKFERGSLLVSIQNQDKTSDQILSIIKEINEKDGINVYATSSGLDFGGVSLGSNSFQLVRKPVIAILVDGEVSATDAGELWHLFDTRYEIPVTLLPVREFNSRSISKYTTIIFPEGQYTSVTDQGKEKLKSWVQAGGTVIGFERAVNWFQTAGIGKFEVKKEDDGKSKKEGDKKEVEKPQPYANIEENRGAKETSGAIFEADADNTNPLLFGFSTKKIPLFKSNNIFLEKATGVYSNPLTYGSNPLVSGYISRANYSRLKNSSCVGVSAVGAGRVIGFTEDMAFRAFWLGTHKLVANAIFYGPLINGEASR